MKSWFWRAGLLAAIALLIGGLMTGPFSHVLAQPAQKQKEGLKKTKLLISLPVECNTPDGMTLDKDQNVILSCPNFNMDKYPGVLMKLDTNNQLSLFYTLPVHPETKKAGPMGLEFDHDGNLYLADNQYFTNKDHKSRLLKIVFKNGKPEKTIVAASGFNLANGVRVRGDYAYVTESVSIEESKPLVSAIYRFRLDEHDVKVQPGIKDPHIIATMETKNPRVRFGADGLAFDSKGNLYVGNFADGTVEELTFDANGKFLSKRLFAQGVNLKSSDCVYSDGTNIYVADLMANAVRVISPTGTIRTLAQNGDTDGADGSLDGPCEVIIRGKQMIVANFDMPFEGCVNTKFEAPYTLSVIDLH